MVKLGPIHKIAQNAKKNFKKNRLLGSDNWVPTGTSRLLYN